MSAPFKMRFGGRRTLVEPLSVARHALEHTSRVISDSVAHRDGARFTHLVLDTYAELAGNNSDDGGLAPINSLRRFGPRTATHDLNAALHTMAAESPLANLARPNLRRYQHDAVADVWSGYQCGLDRALTVLPTGTGKTRTFNDTILEHLQEWWNDDCAAAMWRHDPFHLLSAVQMSPLLARLDTFLAPYTRPAEVLVFAHTDEILTQTIKRLRAVLGEKLVGQIGSGVREEGRLVTVATVQSYYNSTPWDISRVGLMILDEAHHYVPGGEFVRPLIDAGFLTEQGEIRYNYPRLLLGFTATPDRADGISLRATFGPHGLVHARDLTEFVGQRDEDTQALILLPPYGIELRLPGGVAATPIAEQVDALINLRRQRLQVATTTNGPRARRIAIYAASKDAAEKITADLNTRYGIHTADAVCAEVVLGDNFTPHERRKILERFGNANAEEPLNVVVFVGVGLEGMDIPGIEAVAIFREIQESRALCEQIIGRSLRPDPEHPEIHDAIIIDAGGNLARHQLGVPVREIYEGGEIRAVKKGKGNDGDIITDDDEKPPIEPISGPAIVRDLGLLLGHRPGANVSRVLRARVTPPQIHRIAYRLGISDDRLFNYYNGNQTCASLAEVEAIAQEISDTTGELASAWAWDKVAAMERDPAQQLPPELQREKPAAYRLAMELRWAVWRWHDGAITKLGNRKGAAARLHDDGIMPENNSGTSRFEQYEQIASQIATGGQSHATLEHPVRGLIETALRETYSWPRVNLGDHSISARTRAIAALRDAWLRQFAGPPPTEGDGALSGSSPLRNLAQGIWQMRNSGKLSAVEQRTKWIDYVIAADVLNKPSAMALVNAALREAYDWPEIDLTDETISAQRRAIAALRTAWLQQFAGEPFTQGRAGLSEQSPLRRIGAGQWQMRTVGNATASAQREIWLEAVVAAGVLEKPAALVLVNAAIREEYGWQETNFNEQLTSAQNLVIAALRTAWLQSFAGPPPQHGSVALSKTSPLHRLASGLWQMRSYSQWSAIEQRTAWMNAVVASKVLDEDAALVFVNAGIRDDYGWLEVDLNDQSVPVQDRVIAMLQTAWLQCFAGPPLTEGKGAILRGSPLRAIVNGAWPRYKGQNQQYFIIKLRDTILTELTRCGADLTLATPLLDAALEEIYGADWEN